jgi:hypothetical protein
MSSNAAATVYVRKQDRKKLAQQKWSVTFDDSSGMFTIQNSGTNLYLACSNANATQGSPLIGQANLPYWWSVQTFDHGVMFFIRLPDQPLSLGFSDYEAEELSEVVLEPSDNIPSQIWFFETDQPLSQDNVYARCELDAGNYTIQSCHDSSYMAVERHALTIDSSENAATFALKYCSGGPNFTLRYDQNKKDVVNASGYVDLRSSAKDDDKQWVLLPQKTESATVYYICQPALGYPLKVISSRKLDEEYLALDEFAEGEVMQMWNFISAD